MSRHSVPRVLFNKRAVGPFRQKNRRPNDVVVEGKRATDDEKQMSVLK